MMRLPSIFAAAFLPLLALSTGCSTAPESAPGPLQLDPFAKAFPPGLAPQAIASGPEGDVFFGGRFAQPVDFGGGLLQPVAEGSVFVAHLDANAHHLFSGATGGNGSFVQGTAVGPDGEMYVAGSFQGAINFGSGKMTGKWDGYLAAFEKGGASDFSRNIVAKSQAWVDAVAAAPSGGVIIAARADDSSDFGAGPEPDQQGLREIVIASYGLSGSLSWQVRIPAFAVTQVVMTVGSDGNTVFAASAYQSFTFAGTTVQNGAFVGKIGPGGEPLWLSGGSVEQGGVPAVQRVAVDSKGGIFLGGVGYSPFSLGGVKVPVGFGGQIFLMRLEATGDVDFAKVFTSPNGNVQGTELAVTAAGDVLFGATTYGGVNYGDGIVGTGNGSDVTVARFANNGDLQKAIVLQGTGNEYLSDLALDPTGKAVLLGTFDSQLDIGADRLNAEGNNTFLARMDL
jgi:hypothetical protein